MMNMVSLQPSIRKAVRELVTISSSVEKTKKSHKLDKDPESMDEKELEGADRGDEEKDAAGRRRTEL